MICICGHDVADHAGGVGACSGAEGSCEHTEYVGLCAVCGHSVNTHLPTGSVLHQGTWDADTNTPTLADGTGTLGDVYRVNVAGTADLGSGDITVAINDWVIYNGTIWEKSDAQSCIRVLLIAQRGRQRGQTCICTGIQPTTRVGALRRGSTA